MSNNYGSSVVSMYPICLNIYGYARSQLFVFIYLTGARLGLFYLYKAYNVCKRSLGLYIFLVYRRIMSMAGPAASHPRVLSHKTW